MLKRMALHTSLPAAEKIHRVEADVSLVDALVARIPNSFARRKYDLTSTPLTELCGHSRGAMFAYKTLMVGGQFAESLADPNAGSLLRLGARRSSSCCYHR